MSSYIQQTKHPETGEWEDAHWIDDKFGKHKYGVCFPSNPDQCFNARLYDFETREYNPTPLGWDNGDDKFWKVINLCETAPSRRIALHHAFQKIEADAERKEKREVINMIIKLRKEYANTPLDLRGNGWTWLDKLEDILTQTK